MQSRCEPKEEGRLKRRIARGHPFGNASWVESTGRHLKSRVNSMLGSLRVVCEASFRRPYEVWASLRRCSGQRESRCRHQGKLTEVGLNPFWA